MRRQVTVTWTTGPGVPDPTEFSVEREDEVEWEANGSDMTVKFPGPDICGEEMIDVDEGQSQVITISKTAPDGTHQCEIVNRKDPGDGTPPVSMILG